MSTWTIDPMHSAIGFKIRHLDVFWVRGFVKNVRGTLSFDPKNPADFSVEASVDVKDLSTGVEMRDKHLLGPEFFDMEKYPVITFKSSEAKDVRGKKFDVDGTLELHGVKKDVTLRMRYLGDTTDAFGKKRIGFEGSAKIDRRDFGMEWANKTELGAFVAGNEVELTADIQAVPAE